MASQLFKTYNCFIFILVLTGMLSTMPLSAQRIILPEKQEQKEDTVRMAVDSSQMTDKSDNAFQDPVHYSAKDSLVYEFTDADTTIHLYKEAKVKSLDMDLEAGYIEASKKSGQIFGHGIPDSVGELVEKPKFKQGVDEFEMKRVTYNFNSKKARIEDIFTSQGDGLLYGDLSKRMPDGSTFIKGADYTTCDAPHPHFSLRMARAKIVEKPKRFIYFERTMLYIEEVPIPIVIPFGFFPQQQGRTSGIRIPTYGEEVNRGFFLQNLGYYFAIGDHMDLELGADYYTLGSWAVRGTSRYTKRYKYDGSFNMNYAFNATGDKGSSDYQASTTFSVQWSHRMSPKARPGTTFSASVNFASANNNMYNNTGSQNPFPNLNNQIQSSISYTKTWQNSPFSLSFNASHNQRFADSSYNIRLPDITLTMSRIYPFAKKERVGKKAFYEEISFNYSGVFDNSISFKASEVSEPNFFEKMQNGLRHNISIGLPSATLLKHINLTPNVSYGAKWFFKATEYEWNNVKQQRDTIEHGTFKHFGMVHNYNFSASLNTQLYGVATFKKGSMIEAIRHVMKPSVSFTYTPDLNNHFNGWRTVQIDTSGTMKDYNIYAGQSGAIDQRESGSINFSLGNNLEMKVRNRKDSTGIKKVPLLSTFDIGASYDLMKDSMNLSNISFRGSTTLPGQTAVSFGFTLNPYAVDSLGRVTKRYAWQDGFSIGRFTNFNLSFGYSFSGGKSDATQSTKADDHTHDHEHAHNPIYAVNPFIYEPFSVPWSFNFNFGYNYNKSYIPVYSTNSYYVKHNHLPTLGFGGSFSPTQNWDINIQSGFDFKQMKLSMTNISISRKLHCFSFSFNWVPMGRFQSWSFRIGILSSMLSDILKYDKQSSYWDN